MCNDAVSVAVTFGGWGFIICIRYSPAKQHRSPLIPSTRRILAAEVNSDSIAASIVGTHADSLKFSIVAC